MNTLGRRRDRERGSAMLVTLILIAALLAGIAVLASLQLTSTKGTETTRVGLMSLHCAESGLAASHAEIGINRALVLAHIAANPYPGGAWTTNPTFITTMQRDIDGDGVVDLDIYIIDNDDGDGNTGADLDNRVWLISRCTKYPDAPKEVRELVEFGNMATVYDWQEGGAFGNNNKNPIQ